VYLGLTCGNPANPAMLVRLRLASRSCWKEAGLVLIPPVFPPPPSLPPLPVHSKDTHMASASPAATLPVLLCL
jgi:hypothetical protein